MPNDVTTVYVPLYSGLVLFTMMHEFGCHINASALLSAPNVAISILYRGNAAGSFRASTIVAAGDPTIFDCTVISTIPENKLDTAVGVVFFSTTVCCAAGVTDAPTYVYIDMRGGSVFVTSGIGVLNVMLPPL